MFVLLARLAGAERYVRRPAPARGCSPEDDSNILGPTSASAPSSDEKRHMLTELRRNLRSTEETNSAQQKTTRYTRTDGFEFFSFDIFIP